jgi:hypothetical protein
MWDNLEKLDMRGKYIFTKKHRKYINTNVVTITEKRDILGINYRKLREIVKI